MPDYPKADNNQLSVSAWVLAFALNPYSAIVSNWSPRSSDRAQIGQFFLGITDKFDLEVGLIDQSGGEVVAREGDGKVLPRGAWQHVAFVADGTVVHLYRNGIEVAAQSYRGITRQPLPKGLAIGCDMDRAGAGPAPAPTSPGFWDGRLDEIAVFNHALARSKCGNYTRDRLPP